MMADPTHPRNALLAAWTRGFAYGLVLCPQRIRIDPRQVAEQQLQDLRAMVPLTQGELSPEDR